MIISFIFVVRHWVLSTFFVLLLLVDYTKIPLYGAEPTPTPNVSTVPKPGQFVTPSATPPPVVVIITAAAPTGTPLGVAPGNGIPNAPTNSGTATPTAQPAENVPSTTTNALSEQPVPASNRPSNPPASVISKENTVVLLAVTPSQTLIWPGVRFQLQVVVTNRGGGMLTNLEVRQPLSPALAYQATPSDQRDTVQLEETPDQASVLVMHWPQLAQGAVVSRTVELQVNDDTPNGIFLDHPIVAQSAEGATATVDLTLVLPPATLPQFRWDGRQR